MITVSKKAATEAEAEAILHASLQQTAAFGVPTLIIEPTQIKLDKYKWWYIFLGRRMNTMVATVTRLYGERMKDIPKNRRGDILHEVSRVLTAGERAQRMRQHPKYAYKYICSTPNPGVNNIVVFSSAKKDGDIPFIPALDLAKTITADFTPFCSTWNIYGLWHEIGHGLSYDESVADRIAALSCRKFIKNPHALHMFADLRAVKAIIDVAHARLTMTYGWKTTVAIDSVMDMTETESDRCFDMISASNSFTLVPEHNPIGALCSVSEQIKGKAKRAFNKRSLPELAIASRKIMKERPDLTEDEKKIISRFALAAERLSQGVSAYPS